MFTRTLTKKTTTLGSVSTIPPDETAGDSNIMDLAMKGKALSWNLLKKGSTKSDAPTMSKGDEKVNSGAGTEVVAKLEPENEDSNNEAVNDEANDTPNEKLTGELETLVIKEETTVEVKKSKTSFNMSMLNRTTLLQHNSKTGGDEPSVTTEALSVDNVPAAQDDYEGVYIVLQPVEFKGADNIKTIIREFRDQAELQRYILIQHWSIQVGDKFYHLYKNDDDTLGISFVPVDKKLQTVKIPIWRTNLTHEERAGMAIGLIKEMGNSKRDEDVKIYEDIEGKVLTEEERRVRNYSSKAYQKSLLPSVNLATGKYNVIGNNCIHFALNLLIFQLLRLVWHVRNGTLKDTLMWVIEKWHKNGVRRSPKEILDKLMELFSPMKALLKMNVLHKVIQETTRGKLTSKLEEDGEKEKEKEEEEEKEREKEKEKEKAKELKPKKLEPKKQKSDLHPLALLLLFYLDMDDEGDDGSIQKSAEEAGETVVEETEVGVEEKEVGEEGEEVDVAGT